MNSITNIADSILFFAFGLLFFAFGLLGIIKPQLIINQYVAIMTPKNRDPNFFQKLSISIATQKWNLFNVRICSIVIVLVAILFIFLSIASLINPNMHVAPPQ